MSTNYYLVQDPQAAPCRSCGENPTQIHIGLSSVGWTFTWQGYRRGDGIVSDETLHLTTVAEWVAFLEERCAEGWQIINEYGDTTPLAEFLAFVEGKRANGRRGGDEHDLCGKRMDSHTDPCGDVLAFYSFT